MKYKELIDKLHTKQKIYLYGAGIIAYGVLAALEELEQISVDAFVVTKWEGTEEMAGKPVIMLEDVKQTLSDVCFIIATPEVYHQEIVSSLKSYGYHSYVCLDYQLEYSLMSRYFQKKENYLLVETIRDAQDTYKRVTSEDVCVYMAVSCNDKRLNNEYKIPSWVTPIQVGAALTSERIYEMNDAKGENISSDNKLYGEMTASYWAWKNDFHDIVGLFHYRRVLEIEQEALVWLRNRMIDVILPLPFVCYPDTKGQYGRYLLDEDIDIMWEVMREYAPQDYTTAKEVLQGRYLYNYNMLIARKEVFRDYCNWIFPMLQEICNRCEKYERKRLERYIGRIGEVLTSLYFSINKKQWKIGHAMKRWLV